jgi:hypothetical protein
MSMMVSARARRSVRRALSRRTTASSVASGLGSVGFGQRLPGTNALLRQSVRADEYSPADSNEGGHLFQSDRGHHSNLMAASLVSSRGPVLVMS